jgi:hypothetical protein
MMKRMSADAPNMLERVLWYLPILGILAVIIGADLLS